MEGVATHNKWSPEWHINVKELMAVFYGLKALYMGKQGLHILLQIDNVTAVSYISKMGGTKSEQCRKRILDTTVLWPHQGSDGF